MAEYKDITKLKKEISDVKQELWESSCQNRSYITGYVSALSYVERMIASLPTVDVEPVKHSEWAGTVCCCCGESTVNYYDCDYCPNCGAKMDGEIND